jgi:hypothetical protein
MEVLSSALAVVDARGQLDRLKLRIRQEHPPRRSGHRDADDDRLLDCLSEGCAFAWADTRYPSVPRLDYSKGAPDIALGPGGWVEAKAISPGQAAGAQFKGALRGNVVTGGLMYTGEPSRLRAAKDAVEDGQRKFARMGAAGGIVFLNLAALSFADMMVEEDIRADFVAWADGVVSATPGLQLVLVMAYEWRTPFREPALAPAGG